MAEFDDMLAGIRAQPHDELRRLVFADWLDENAHANPVYGPWASYIRWAIAAANTPRTHPDYWAYRRYPESPPPGVAKLLGVDSLPVKPEWTGGFPDCFANVADDTLQVHDRKIAAFLGPIRRLTVKGEVSLPWLTGRTVQRAGELEVTVGSDLKQLTLLASHALPPFSMWLAAPSEEVVADELIAEFACRDFPTLTGLIVQNVTAPRMLASAPSLPRLTTLNLAVKAGATGFDALPPYLWKLATLRLDRQGRDDFLPLLAAGCSPVLTTLECPPADAGTPGWIEFVASPAFGRLRRLVWRGGGENTADPIWPDDVPEPDTGELILNAVQLGAGRSFALFASPMLHRCQCLFVENCAVTPEAYLALADNPSARNLKVLSVQMPFKSEPFAHGDPFSQLCWSPHLAGLTELSLTFHDLTDEDFDELLSATFAGGLRYLNLAGSYFSERLLERLTDPSVLPALTWLDIHAPTNGSRRLEPALQKRFGPHFAL